jgi:hypothetical protein
MIRIAAKIADARSTPGRDARPGRRGTHGPETAKIRPEDAEAPCERRPRRHAAAGAAGVVPDPVEWALAAERAGAEGITCHLRKDRRHIQDEDVDACARGSRRA